MNSTDNTNASFMRQFDDCKLLVDRIKAVMDAEPIKQDWVLIAPGGQMWQGDYRSVLRVLLQKGCTPRAHATHPTKEQAK